MPDGERVGRGYIDIRPNLDMAAFEAAKTRIRASMAGLNNDISRDTTRAAENARARMRSTMAGLNNDVARDTTRILEDAETNRTRIYRRSNGNLLNEASRLERDRTSLSSRAARARNDEEGNIISRAWRRNVQIITDAISILPGRTENVFRSALLNPVFGATFVVAGATASTAFVSGFMATLGTAFLAGGVVLAFVRNANLREAGKALGLDLWAGLKNVSAPLDEPIYEALQRLRSQLPPLLAPIRGIFKTLAPTLAPLTQGLIDFTRSFVEGMTVFAVNVRPAMEALGTIFLPQVGAALQKFFIDTTSNQEAMILGMRMLTGIVVGALGYLSWLIKNFQTVSVVVNNMWTAVKPRLIAFGEAVKSLYVRDVAPYVDRAKGKLIEFGNEIKTLYLNVARPYMKQVGQAIASFAVQVPGWLHTATVALTNWSRETVAVLTDFYHNHMVPTTAGIGQSVENMYNNHIRPTHNNWVGSIRDWLAPIITWLGTNVIVPMVNLIVHWYEFMWNRLWPIFSLFVSTLRDILGPTIVWLWQEIVQPIWGLVHTYISAVCAALEVEFGLFQIALKILGTVMQALWDNVIHPVWDAIFHFIEFAVNAVIDGPIGKLTEAILNKLPAAFNAGLAAIGQAWDTFRRTCAVPINFIINTVLNDGILKAYNKLAGVFHVKPDNVHVDPIPGYAQGGYTGAGSKYQPAGIVHAGEYVMPMEQTSNPHNFAILEAMRAGAPGYADGGLVGWFKDKAGDVGREIKNIAQDVYDLATDPSKTLGKIADGLWAKTPGEGLPKDMAIGAGKTALNGIIEWVKEHITKNFSSGSANVMAIQDWLRKTVDPLPYVWGAVGPGAYDCSGIVGEVIARLLGMPSYKRYFVTGSSEGGFLQSHGFKSGAGDGSFVVGYSDSHTMGRIGGLNFEAQNPGAGIVVGSGTTDVMSFPHIYSLDLGKVGIGAATAVGANVKQWIMSAIQATGVPISWLNGLATIVSRESGGNPNAVNNSDINAALGHPSMGLAQVIQPTFNAYHQPGTSNSILDPVANIAAAINYIKSRYGSITAVQQANPALPAKGYDSGGYLQPGWNLAYNGLGTPEPVLTPNQLDSVASSPTIVISSKDGWLEQAIDVRIEHNNKKIVRSLRAGPGRK